MAATTTILRLTSGERFLIDRHRRRLTQFQAAAGLGIYAVDYGRVERGQVKIPGIKAPALGKLKPHERCLILRRRSQMTQAELALKLKCSRYWCNKMEHGESPGVLIDYWSKSA